jgi:hypothetical protein
MRHDSIAAHAAEVVERTPAVAFHRLLHAGHQRFDDVRSDRVIEHCRGADLHRAASKQEVIQRVREIGDTADARERLVRERLSELAHLGQRQRQNRRTAETTARHMAVNVHFELQGVGIDQRQRRERIGRHDRIGAAEKRAARLDDDVGRRRGELRPDRHTGDLFHDLRHDRDQLLVLADVRSHVLAIHMRAREVQLQCVRALGLTRLRQRLPVGHFLIAAGARHDRGDENLPRVRLLDARNAWHPPVERLVGDELPVPRRVQHGAAPLLHRQPRRVDAGAQEFRLRPVDVDDRVQADCFGDDTTPPCVERAHDVAVRFGWRR